MRNGRSLLRILERKFGDATVTTGASGTEIVFDCPHCGRRKLNVNPGKNAYHCWVCGDHGKLSELLEMKPSDIRAMKANLEPRKKKATKGYIPPGPTVPVQMMSYESAPCLYLLDRGFDPKAVGSVFGIEYCQAGVSFAGGVFNTSNTLVIPVARNGVSVAWQARLLYNPDKIEESLWPSMGWKWDDEKKKFRKPPKYFTMPGFDKGRFLFNHDNAEKFGFVVVTEGAFDAMSVGRCAVAAFGKGLTDIQIGLLKSWDVIVLLLDPDASSDQAKLARRLRTFGKKVVEVKLEGWKDAGECPHAELVERILDACDAAGVDLSSMRADGDPFESGRRARD